MLYDNYTQVFTTDPKIKAIEDIKGKRVSVGAAGSGTETIALRVLEAAKLDPDKDIKRQQLAPAECVQAMKDRSLDVCFWSGGAKTRRSPTWQPPSRSRSCRPSRTWRR